MKAKIFFPIPIFFLSISLLVGQVEFPTLNAHWCYNGYTELSFDPWTYCISPSVLVELNGKTYSKITYFPHPNDSEEKEILYRGEDRKFYVIPQDSIDEILIYDFDLEVGDTFVATWGWQIWGDESLEVYDVDSIVTVDGVTRKRISLGNVSSSGTWIEGIGSQNWIFVYPGYSGWLDAGYDVTCHFQNEEGIYSHFGSFCDFDLVTNTKETKISTTFDLYPNPTSSILNINFKDLKVNKMKIIDLSGRIVFQEEIDSEYYNLETHHILESGVFLIQIHTNDGILTKKFVKN